jgi:transposase
MQLPAHVPLHCQAKGPRPHLAATYRRIAATCGPKKALVAVEHAILTAIWTMAHTGAEYDEPAPTTTSATTPERVKRHATNQLQHLGFTVTLTPAAASA